MRSPAQGILPYRLHAYGDRAPFELCGDFHSALRLVLRCFSLPVAVALTHPRRSKNVADRHTACARSIGKNCEHYEAARRPPLVITSPT